MNDNTTKTGDVQVGGDLTVRRNLRVEGWLDAPNIKNPAKGLYASAEALVSATPWPRHGEWAMVGSELPAELYVAEGGKWHATGRKVSLPSLDTSGLETILQANSAEMARIGEQLACAGELCESADDAATRAVAAADKAIDAAHGIGATVALLREEVSEAEKSADEAFDRACRSGIVEFSGVIPSRGGARPQSGVWFETGNDWRPGHFLVLDNDFGTSESDYNDMSTLVDGVVPAREDRLYRTGNRLYLYSSVERMLQPLLPGPVEVADSDTIELKIAAGECETGQLYCTVHPITRRVTNLYLG